MVEVRGHNFDRSLPSPSVGGLFYVTVFALLFPSIYFLLGISLDSLVGNPLPASSSLLASIGIPLTLIGAVFIGWATVLFAVRGKGWPVSSSPPEQLVRNGPYRLSRHPIYLGATLLFVGGSVLLHSFWSACLGGPLLGVFYFSYARGIEEPALLRRYGRRYRDYQSATPFIVGFPFRRTAKQIAKRGLATLSALVNRPQWVQFGEHILFWGYGMWPGLGVFLGLSVMEYLLVVRGVRGGVRAASIVAIAATALVGVRLTYRGTVAVRDRTSFRNTAGKVGFVSWGVVPALVLTTGGITLLSDLSPLVFLDAALPSLLVAHVFGRIGCTFYGCCHGKETESPFHLHYRHPVLKVLWKEEETDRCLLPVQPLSSLYGGLGALLIFGLWVNLPLQTGLPASLATAWYGLFRLDEEWLREQSVLVYGLISPAQLISLFLAIIGASSLFLLSFDPHTSYSHLSTANVFQVLPDLHVFLLVASGLTTFLLFSYHYEHVGQWRR